MLSRLRHRCTRFLFKLQGRQPIHFLHIGKTGGTAVKHALRQAEDHRYGMFLHPHGVRLRDVPEGERVIFFVRDPISRFVSAFHSRKRQGQPRYFSPWSPGERVAFQRFGTPNELAAALSSPDLDVREGAVQAMNSIEHVRDSYWNWFENEDYLRSRMPDILFIGFQEHLDRDFGALRSKLGLSPAVNLPLDDVAAHRNPRGLDTHLDDAAVENLRDWFKTDYQFVELCRTVVGGR